MLRLIRWLLPALLPATLVLAAGPASADLAASPLAPGYGELGYAPPPVGSYQLPPPWPGRRR
jgi:hypothetical protein